MTVKRYGPVASGLISPSDSGEYVKYEDYAALKNENEKIKSELEVLKTALNYLRNRSGKSWLDESRRRIADLQAQVNALAAENSYIRNEIKRHSECTHQCEKCGEADPCFNDDVCSVIEHPFAATDAAIREIKAQGLDEAAAEIDNWVGCDLLANKIRSKAEKLRSGEVK